MKKIFLFIAGITIVFSCNEQTNTEKLTVAGEIKNSPDQKIYLEELFFSQKDPEVLDTANIEKGKFKLEAPYSNEGLFRLRLERHNTGYIFINDHKKVTLSADINDSTLQGPSFNTPANRTLKNFIASIYSLTMAQQAGSERLEQLKNVKSGDSSLTAAQKEFDENNSRKKNYVLGFIDTVSDPVLAMFALGYTRDIEPNQLEKPVQNVIKRFPKNELIQSMSAQFNKMMSDYNATPHIGGTAPDISMTDTSGKAFSLSQLRGKYVLVDFWASWCRPCRNENPNVVASFNKFKDKNFTVLGVSLDKEKQDWITAINQDHLAWYHISDLKYWNSAAVPLYKFEGIPYNVLVDPAGKIIALNLRGTELTDKLSSVLQ